MFDNHVVLSFEIYSEDLLRPSYKVGNGQVHNISV